MKTRRLTISGLSLVAALSFGVAGCANATGDTGGGASPAPRTTSSASPEDALGALTSAAQQLNNDTVKMELGLSGLTGMKMTGTMDPAARKASLVMDLSIDDKKTDVDVRGIDNDFYLKSDFASTPDKWMHLDASRVGDGSPLAMLATDSPGGANGMVKAVVDVERDGEHGFRGSLDLTKAPAAVKQVIGTLNDKAEKVPFTAAVDDKGRLTALVVDLSAVNPVLGKMETTYSDFGVPVTVDKPAAAETVEAPADVVAVFGG